MSEEQVKHPVQPLIVDTGGVLRFKKNAIVEYLLDSGPFDLNHLATIPFDLPDREQFTQLIGYSLDGFGELSYVTDETCERAIAGIDPQPPRPPGWVGDVNGPGCDPDVP